MSKRSIEYLKHIRDELDYLIHTSIGLGREEFLRNETLKRSFTRSLEIIGEAAKNLPEDFRQKNIAK